MDGLKLYQRSSPFRTAEKGGGRLFLAFENATERKIELCKIF